MGPPTQEELEDVQKVAATLSVNATVEVLASLLEREYKLVEKCDGDERLVFLHNITAFIAAIARLQINQAQTSSPQSETPPG